ncbi:MAG: S1C family serine protease, partial [Planctomycetota bacterium]
MTRRLFLNRSLAMLLAFVALASPLRADDLTTNRKTPLVTAVERCRGAVVNLRGRKTVSQQEKNEETSAVVALEEEARQVNGMGTGVVIDPRGYILTNYHVVQDVKQIQVTMADRQTATATLLAHDPETDLALLKIPTREPLQTIPLGTSSDLMLAETVAAVGNAYGYDNTVTVGIISHLN